MSKISRINSNEASKRLDDVSDDQQFYCKDGTTFKNIIELGKALVVMEDETFEHHTTRGGINDFSAWVKDVIGDDKLANEISKSSTQIEASEAVSQRIAFLQCKVIPDNIGGNYSQTTGIWL
ncbi:MAG: hypothetical protein SVY53_04230 [Chloroflexota bacterium]|nr:hypothetical protein [Chloroflexota bacterium]